jgi:hypothetical protein
MLQMLSLDVADICCWLLQTLFFYVADVEFPCCGHLMLGVVSRRREKRLLMLDVARNTDRNMGEERRKTPDVGCCKQPRSQHLLGRL